MNSTEIAIFYLSNDKTACINDLIPVYLIGEPIFYKSISQSQLYYSRNFPWFIIRGVLT